MAARVTEFVIDGLIDRADIPALCDRFRRLLEEAGQDSVVCDVGALRRLDATTVDALARLQLVARRLGRQMYLGAASDDLLNLVELIGLRRILPRRAVPRRAASGVEPGRQSE